MSLCSETQNQEDCKKIKVWRFFWATRCLSIPTSPAMYPVSLPARGHCSVLAVETLWWVWLPLKVARCMVDGNTTLNWTVQRAKWHEIRSVLGQIPKLLALADVLWLFNTDVTGDGSFCVLIAPGQSQHKIDLPGVFLFFRAPNKYYTQ